MIYLDYVFFFFQAEGGIRDYKVTGVQTCALPICLLAVGQLQVARGRGELHPVPHGESPLLLAVDGYALLAPWVVALFRAVLPLDGEPVVVRIDEDHARILAFADAGLLRAAAVAQHIALVVPCRPRAICSGEVLARYKHLGAVFLPADNAPGL